MKSSTENKIKGKILETKGKAKQVAGVLSDDPVLQSEGELEELRAKLQQQLGEIGKKLGK